MYDEECNLYLINETFENQNSNQINFKKMLPNEQQNCLCNASRERAGLSVNENQIFSFNFNETK